MAKTNTKARPVGGDMTVYTALLVVTAIVLLGGIGVLWASNVSRLQARWTACRSRPSAEICLLDF
jgi:hypothetical protein